MIGCVPRSKVRVRDRVTDLGSDLAIFVVVSNDHPRRGTNGSYGQVVPQNGFVGNPLTDLWIRQDLIEHGTVPHQTGFGGGKIGKLIRGWNNYEVLGRFY